jgi:hypothetical protein
MIRGSRLGALIGSLVLAPAVALGADPVPAAPSAAAPSAPPAASPTAIADPPPAPPPPPPPPAPPAKKKSKPGAPAKAGDAPAEAPKTDAKKPDDAKKLEAAQRFDRGIQLFDEGDNAGALAEFKRTYEILPNAVVLYNIGLVYAAMARPVDAVDALEPAIAGGGLNAKQLERAKTTLSDQKARIGRLSVTTTPEGARVEVDNVEVATTPLAAPIRIAEGSHIIGAVAEGYAPARKEVVVAGNSDATLHLDLVATQGKQLANLTVHGTDGAEVRVDNEVLGKTPLETSITLVAGHHVVELRRPGYTTTKREVDIGEGATGELDVTLAVDAAALGREGATFVLDASEPGADVTIDGERKGLYREPLRLPRGPHLLSVSANGFIPSEREIELDSTQTNVIKVQLEPTLEKRASYKSNANFHRTWGWIGIIGGAAIAGGGVALVAVGGSNKSTAQNDLTAAQAKAKGRQEPPCDAANAYKAEDGDDGAACQAAQDDAANRVDSAKNLQIAGYVGIGVGAAVAVTGVVLLLTGNDPDHYDHPASRQLGKSRTPRFALVPGPGQFGQGLSVSF